MTRKEKYMKLEDLLKTLGNEYQFICVLVARFVDKDGFTSDFTYKGCAMSNDWLLDYLPTEILNKPVIRFEKFDGFSLDNNGEIVKVDFKIIIEF